MCSAVLQTPKKHEIKVSNYVQHKFFQGRTTLEETKKEKNQGENAYWTVMWFCNTSH